MAICIEMFGFEVAEKDRAIERGHYRIALLVLLLLLAAAVIVLIIGHLQKIRRRAENLQRLSDTREQIIEFLSNDLRNPASEYTSGLKDLVALAGTLSADEIRQRCEQISQKAQTINRDVAKYVGDIVIERSRVIADIGLSKREIEIIRLSAQGLTAADIADKLSLSVYTVNNHRQRIYNKLDVRNVTEMIHKATDLGIIMD